MPYPGKDEVGVILSDPFIIKVCEKGPWVPSGTRVLVGCYL